MKIRIALLKKDKTWEEMFLKMRPCPPWGYSAWEVITTFINTHPEFLSGGRFIDPYIAVVHISKEKKKRTPGKARTSTGRLRRPVP